MSKITLGRGLRALIPEDIDLSDKKSFVNLEIDKIRNNPEQPRRDFNQEALANLTDSIRQNGVLQPLLVEAVNGTYQIIAGERRFRAAREAGLRKVPAIILDDLDRMEKLKLALIENLQREDLNPIELAEGYHNLMGEHGLTQEDLAVRLSKSRSAIANTLRLLNLPEEVRSLLRANKLSGGHARTLLAIEDESEQVEAAKQIAERKMSVRELENRVYSEKREKKKRGKSLKVKKLPEDYLEAETRLKQYLGTKVNLKKGLKRGRIEIEFYSDSDLTRILDLIVYK